MATPPLPLPRQLATSLIASLPDLSNSPGDIDLLNRTANLTNPLKGADVSTRQLITTLHALFPDTLLKALDLLDRGLVTRIVLSSHGGSSSVDHASARFPGNEVQQDVSQQATSQQAQIHSPAIDRAHKVQSEEVSTAPSKPYFYLVKSSQEPRNRSRFTDASSYSDSGTGKAYIVRTTAWNCSCEAFAFAAFPSSPLLSNRRPSSRNTSKDQPVRSGLDKAECPGEKWEFGGCSNDGRDGGAVPCCKHLLACVLGERWQDVLGGYVNERSVGREEMAGLSTAEAWA